MYHLAVHKLPHSVLAYIRSHGLLKAGDRVGIAVSGGADSVALLRILLELRQELGIVLSVVHLNHMLRGTESDADEAFVRKLATAHDLQSHHESADVKADAAEKKLSLETAARQLRYDFFERLLASGNLNKVATAHTLDDQAETVLLKLARGASTRGLAGIYPRLDLNHHGVQDSTPGNQVVRPLLAVSRAELETYLREIRQNWREDSSNRDLQHTRNRIRHEILPRLEQHVNPAVRAVLADTAEIARADENFWTELVSAHLPKIWTALEESGDLDAGALYSLPLALQRRVVRAAGEALGLSLEFHHVEEVLGLNAEGARASLPQNWCASWHKGKICFELGSEPASDYAYPLSVPGRVQVCEAGVTIEALVGTASDAGYHREQLLDRSYAQRGLLVRNWRAGDRFWPAHTSQPKKIKELLQDRHITGPEKRVWPVVASADEVAWLRGFGVRRDLVTKGAEGVVIREVKPE